MNKILKMVTTVDEKFKAKAVVLRRFVELDEGTKQLQSILNQFV